MEKGLKALINSICFVSGYHFLMLNCKCIRNMVKTVQTIFVEELYKLIAQF